MAPYLPKRLTFMERTLSYPEIEALAEWYHSLRVPDKSNVMAVLDASYKWMRDEAEQTAKVREEYLRGTRDRSGDQKEDFLQGDYFVIGAIGSTVAGKADYNDVDLILVTNRIWRDMESFEPLFSERLGTRFNYTIDPTIPDAYNAHWGRPYRSLVTLIPRNGKGKNVQLTLQPEIDSESQWREHDKEPSVTLLRFGHTEGYRDYIPFSALSEIIEFREALGSILGPSSAEMKQMDDTQLRTRLANQRIKFSDYDHFPPDVVEKMKARKLTRLEFVHALHSSMSEEISQLVQAY